MVYITRKNTTNKSPAPAIMKQSNNALVTALCQQEKKKRN
jgi:hypothetical protein